MIVESAKHPRAGRDELPEPEPTLESVDDIPDQIDVTALCFLQLPGKNRV